MGIWIVTGTSLEDYPINGKFSAKKTRQPVPTPLKGNYIVMLV